MELEKDDLKKYFPYEENIDFKKLLLNDIGLYSISKPDDAQMITNFIIHMLESCKLPNAEELTITDATAGFGGNSLNFSKYFKKVISVEKYKDNYEILKHNLNIYEVNNVETLYGSFLKHIPEKCGDVIFFDPPWGGKKYKFKNSVMLNLDNVPIYDIINQIPNKSKIIAIKIPANFDYGSFINRLYPNQSVVNKKIKNYNLLIIHRINN